MMCHYCKRRVRDSFTDKLNHIVKYHPDRFLHTAAQWPQYAFEFGNVIGRYAREAIESYATKNIRAR